MHGSSRPVWFCVVVGALGLALVPASVALAIVWACSWLGLAIFFDGARRRFPRFLPLAPPASLKDLGIGDDELEGAVVSPWWLLLFVGTAWLCTILVPLMSPGVALVGFGVTVAASLLGCALWLSIRQRPSARVAVALLRGAQRPGVVAARGTQPVLRRQTGWFTITGMAQGTALVSGVHGGMVQVATQTPTSNTYGFTQEERRDLEVDGEGDRDVVRTHDALWAAPRRKLPSAPPLVREDLREGMSMAGAFIRTAFAWEEEAIAPGDRVLVATDAQVSPGSRVRHTIVFGVDSGRDPAQVLRAELLRRRSSVAAMCGLAALALVASLA